jgi:hypothetical protein
VGDGIKLPENERPPVSSISKRLDERISRKIQNIFVQDIQNDCTCSIETYDSDICNDLVYLSKDGIQNGSSNKIPLPMLNNICEKDIINLLELACKKAGNKWDDILLSKMLYNPANDGKKMIMVFEKYIHPIHVNRSGDVYGWIPMDFVPLDCVYLIPEPEFFGVLSVNIDKFGAFCFTNNIIKVDLKEE